jgi:hypothetical protein
VKQFGKDPELLRFFKPDKAGTEVVSPDIIRRCGRRGAFQSTLL